MRDFLSTFEAFQEPGFVRALFSQQRAFVRDGTRFKAALCGRRAGKTETIAAWLLDAATKRERALCPYIALSQKNARRIIWPTLQRVCMRHGVQAEFNEQTLECRLPNGSRVWVTGCDNRAQCEDFRGNPYPRAAIDEAGSFPDWLAYLVDDVLTPALMDYRGELALIGTPGLTPLGFFYDITEGDQQWKTHRWTCLDNPHVPGAEELRELKERKRWNDEHPTYVREWLGRWVRDESALVYPFDPLRNLGEMPQAEGRVVRVLSVDLGFEPDPCAFVVGASRHGDPTWFGEKAWRKARLTVAKIAAEIEQALHNGRREDKPIDRIVVDAGALGKTIVADLQETYGIACEATDKRDKLATIHEFRGGMLAGTVKLAPLACQQLREEWTTCAWNDTRDDHDERCVDDLCDSALYNFRSHGLYYAPELNPPTPGSPEDRAQYKAMRLRQLKEDQRSRRRTA